MGLLIAMTMKRIVKMKAMKREMMLRALTTVTISELSNSTENNKN
jgi:hypothetical protein